MRALPWFLASFLLACAAGSPVQRGESAGAPTVAHPRPTPEELGRTEGVIPVEPPELSRPSRREPGSKPLRLGEIMEILEASPRPYAIRSSSTGRYTNDVWPVGEEPPYWFRIGVGPQDGLQIRGFDFDAPSGRKVIEAEPHFKARRHVEAARLYREALALDGDFYPAQLNLGDALLFGGDPEAALVEYARAAALVPEDHKPWFFAATALLRLERPEKALDFYARALSLRPTSPDLRAAIEGRAEGLGVRVMPAVLEPRARAFREGETIVIEGDPASPAWMGHATCKALWLGESDLRIARTGREAHRWTHREESECVLALIEAHLKTRAAHPDPQLDRLLRIVNDGFLHELIVHEVAARIVPFTVQFLAPEFRERLHQYVKRHVLVPVAAEE